MDTLERTLTIKNSKGLHVRAATALAQTAGRFDAVVTIEHGGERANAKSVMNLLLLVAPQGAVVRVNVSGKDATSALEAVTELIDAGFGE